MSDNPIDFDDPKLTAYVLGELEESEKAELEQQLSANGGLKSAVDEMREFTDLLGNALNSESAPKLTDAQRQMIQSAAGATAAVAAIDSTIAASPAPASAPMTSAPTTRSSWPLLATTATLLTAAGIYIAIKAFEEQPVNGVAITPSEASRYSEKTLSAKTARFAQNDENKYGNRDEQLAMTEAADDRSRGLEYKASRFDSAEKKDAFTVEKPHDAANLTLRKSVPGQQSKPQADSGGKKDFGAVGDAVASNNAGPTATQPTPFPSTESRKTAGFVGGGLGGGVGRRPQPSAPQSAAPLPPAPGGAPSPNRSRGGRSDLQDRSKKKSESAPAFGGNVPPGFIPPGEPSPASRRAIALAAPEPADGASLAKDGKFKTPAAKIDLDERLKPEAESKPRTGFGEGPGNEDYQAIIENPFIIPNTMATVKSTFSIDVDTGAYSNMRRFLTHNQRPPRNAVRIEELINYFHYDYPQPADGNPFSVNVEAAACPWNSKHQLVRIGLKGREILKEDRPPSNLVFLVDTSGSMGHPKKLPLVKKALTLLTQQMGEGDRVAIVTYAGTAAVTLNSTSGEHRDSIQASIDQLRAAGSTNGGGGIVVAYQQAVENFYDGGTNRVIMCTDGDFNVGIPMDKMIELIEEKRKTGVYLSVCGFGSGNLKEKMLEQVANKGNGQYSYIDNEKEAHKVFVEEMTGSLYTIAKDVKIQIDFNPNKVGAYRLIGYENRVLANRDFNDDTKDAGEIGAGHRVTALYELVPPEAVKDLAKPDVDDSDPSKYLKAKPVEIADSKEVLTVRLRYKRPDADPTEKSTLIEQPLLAVTKRGMTSTEFDWASSVAMFGLMLRDSQYKGQSSFDLVTELAMGAKGKDESGRRQEFIDLVGRARTLMTSGDAP